MVRVVEMLLRSVMTIVAGVEVVVRGGLRRRWESGDGLVLEVGEERWRLREAVCVLKLARKNSQPGEGGSW